MEKDKLVSSNRRRAHDAAQKNDPPQPPIVVNISANRTIFDMDAVITSFFTTVSNMTSQPPIPTSVMQETMAILLNPFAKSKEVLTSFVPPTAVVPAIKSSSSAFSIYQQQSQSVTADGHQEIPEKPIEQLSELSTSFASSSSSATVAPPSNNNLSAFKVYQRPDQFVPAVHHSIFENLQPTAATAGNNEQNARNYFLTSNEQGPSVPKRQRME